MPRNTAIGALLAVESRNAFSNIALDQALRKRELEPRDAALATELVYGVLKHQRSLDSVLNRWLRRPLAGMDAVARTALRVGAYQLLRLQRVPPFAAIDETVAAVKPRRPRLAGVVNAVLRRLSENREALIKELARPVHGADDLGWRYGLPSAIAESLIERFDLTEAIAYGEAIQSPAPVTLRVRQAQRREEMLAALEAHASRVERTALSPWGIRIFGGGRPDGLPPLSAGQAVVQDEASQLVAALADPSPDARILDLCAGRGGKTLHLADWQADAGDIVAHDISTKKLRQLQTTADRLGLRSIRAHRPEDGDLAAEGGFDLVLVDAPCSGTGLFRRHPELRWKWSPTRAKRLCALQASLLDQGADRVCRGGHLVYSVCSDLPEEGREAVEAFIARRPDFTREASTSAISWKTVEDVGGDLLLHPHRHGTDGFYAARLLRRPI